MLSGITRTIIEKIAMAVDLSGWVWKNTANRFSSASKDIIGVEVNADDDDDAEGISLFLKVFGMTTVVNGHFELDLVPFDV